jgi:hypothetical protein
MRDLRLVAALPPPLLKIMEPLLHATRNRLALILRLNLPVLITLLLHRPLPALHNRARTRGTFNGMGMLLGTNIFMPPDPLVALLLNAQIRVALNAAVATIPRVAPNAVTITIITLKVAPNAPAIRIILLLIALEALLVRRIQTIAVPLALLPIAPALLPLRANALNAPLIPINNALTRAAIPLLRRADPVRNARAIAPAALVARTVQAVLAALIALPALALALIASARLNAKLRWSRRSLPALSRSHLRSL